MLGLATPLALLALPLPLLTRLLPAARGETGALRVPSTLVGDGQGGGGRSGPAARRRLALILAAAAWVLAVVAFAGPQTVMPSAALPVSGRDLMLVLDFSGSMERKDFSLGGRPVRRIDAVKEVAAEFLRRRAGDRVGLVLFAENAELASVPTFDLAAVERVLRDTEIGTLGRSTAIGDGLGLALKRLKDPASPSRAIVLLSDGTATAGAVGALAAAGLAKSLGIRVHTIALGTDEAASETSGGATSLVDTKVLAAIAAASGGETFRVRTTDDLRAVTAAIERLEASRATAPPVSVARQLWPYPAAAALLACLAGFAAERWRRG
jgi:Ca-activated chloride channel family protein